MVAVVFTTDDSTIININVNNSIIYCPKSCNSTLIGDMLTSCHLDHSNNITITLPVKFVDAINNYIWFVNTNNTKHNSYNDLINNNSDSSDSSDSRTLDVVKNRYCSTPEMFDKQYLQRCLELSDFIDDNRYFEYLLQFIFDNWTQMSSVVYDGISNTLQYKILLSCPYDFLPDMYLGDDIFMKVWLSKPPHKIIVNSSDMYEVNVTSINSITNETTIKSFCYTDDNRTYKGKIFIVTYHAPPLNDNIKVQYCYNIVANDNEQENNKHHVITCNTTVKSHCEQIENILYPNIYDILNMLKVTINDNVSDSDIDDINSYISDDYTSQYSVNYDNDGNIDNDNNGDINDGKNNNQTHDYNVLNHNNLGNNLIDDINYNSNDDICTVHASQFETKKRLSEVLYERLADNEELETNIVLAHNCWKRWYPEGNLMYIRHYDHGQKVGNWIGYTKNSKCEYEVEFHHH